MPSRTTYLCTCEAQQGMVLAESANAVAPGNVAFSLPAGHHLTEENLIQLARHQVQYVAVYLPDERTPEQQTDELERCRAHLQQLFEPHSTQSPCTLALVAQVLAFRAA